MLEPDRLDVHQPRAQRAAGGQQDLPAAGGRTQRQMRCGQLTPDHAHPVVGGDLVEVDGVGVPGTEQRHVRAGAAGRQHDTVSSEYPVAVELDVYPPVVREVQAAGRGGQPDGGEVVAGDQAPAQLGEQAGAGCDRRTGEFALPVERADELHQRVGVGVVHARLPQRGQFVAGAPGAPGLRVGDAQPPGQGRVAGEQRGGGQAVHAGTDDQDPEPLRVPCPGR